MMMALAERFIALAGHHVGSPSVAFMRDNTAQSIRRRSENTYQPVEQGCRRPDTG